MAKYQKYAEYNDSGIEWLGEIPRHWEIKKLVWFFSAEKGKNGQLLTKEYCGLNTGEFPVYSGQTENNGIMGSIDSYEFDVGNNGVLFSTTVGAKAMTLSFLQGKFSLSQNCMIIKPRKNNISTRFYYYHCQPLFSKERGLIPEHMQASFRVEDLYSYRISLPPITEQFQIANFLDHETAQIDTLIAKQEKLIELLKEKRQAVISHAVTKGLNPNVAMKDSGVEWLGEVPEHWEVCKIQYYAKIESGHTPSKTNEKYWENCTIPWVSLNDSKQLRVVDYITDTKYQISELGLANSSARILPKETVVFTRDASIGLSAITTREMAVSQHLIAWLPNKEKLSPEFLLLIFYAMEKEFNRYTFGSTIKTIGMDDVSSLMASFPPLAEQLEIVSRSFSQFELIDTSIEKSNCLLNILKERRTALISAAVTGRIDVRNWQNPNKNKEADMELSA